MTTVEIILHLQTYRRGQDFKKLTPGMKHWIGWIIDSLTNIIQ